MTNPDLIHWLLNRRSTSAIGEPAPTAEQLRALVRAGTTVPDHGRLRPYRFVVITAAGKRGFGEALAEVVDVARGGIAEELKEKFRKRAEAAPVQIAVIYSPKSEEKTPHWEQLVCASCTGYAIILAAAAMELGANWRSSSVMEGDALTRFFSLTPGERLLGWVNVGQAVAAPAAGRDESGIDDLVTTI